MCITGHITNKELESLWNWFAQDHRIRIDRAKVMTQLSDFQSRVW